MTDIEGECLLEHLGAAELQLCPYIAFAMLAWVGFNCDEETEIDAYRIGHMSGA